MGIGTLDERKRQSGAEPKGDRWLKQYNRLLIHAENDHVTVRQEALPHVFDNLAQHQYSNVGMPVPDFTRSGLPCSHQRGPPLMEGSTWLHFSLGSFITSRKCIRFTSAKQSTLLSFVQYSINV